MLRIQPVDPKSATGDVKSMFDAAQDRLGGVPNFLRVLAHSPKALAGFLDLYGALESASLDRAVRERIALTVAEANSCSYCLSAHTAIGRHAGLSNEEMLRNRRGTSDNAKAAAIVAFARAVIDQRGATATDLLAARNGGLSDAEVMETIAVVTLNVFTNLIGKSTGIEIDFPLALPLSATAAA